MIRGLYTAASGMIMQEKRQESIANNLANSNTVGFKRDEAVMHSFPELLISRMNDSEDDIPQVKLNKTPFIGKLGTGVMLEDVITVHSAGAYRQTGGNLDMAIGGSGFFVVDTAQGERYTRNGNFKLSEEGYLVTNEGYQVLGEQGPIQINSLDFHVTSTGEIMVDGSFVDMLRIADFADKTELKKAGDNLYIGDNPEAAVNFTVRQGFLELSNVNAIKEMVNMITAMRTYEANSKAIQAQDGTLDKAVNEVGRV